MAPPRKPNPAEPGRGHSVHLRLATDVFERVEADAKAQGRPMNRVIINDLAAIPWLRSQAKLAETVQNMEVILAKYGARITLADADQELLNAVDEALAAQSDGQLQARLDKVRVVRSVVKKHVEPQVKRAFDADDRREEDRLHRFREDQQRAAEERLAEVEKRIAEAAERLVETRGHLAETEERLAEAAKRQETLVSQPEAPTPPPEMVDKGGDAV
jgi:hypothetical protein